MKPDATKHNPDPAYLRSLLRGAGVSQLKAAALIGVGPRTMRRYLAKGDTPAPYAVQFALEALRDER